MTDTDHDLLKNHVQAIADSLTSPDEDELNEDDEPYTAMDYVFEALDIEYYIGSDGEYRGARLLVAFGGPNIWVDVKTDRVEGYWWGSSYTTSFTDTMDLYEACRELWECRG